LGIAAVSASAQPIISAKSGVIANVEGKVLIDNAEVQQSATHFPEVKEGSTLRTEEGRVELMLPPGFMLRMGEKGALKMISNRLIDTRVDFQSGSAVVEVDQTKGDYTVTIALKDEVVTLSKVGVYRFDSDPAQLKVFHGSATVEVNGQNVMIGTGRLLSLTGGVTAAAKFDADQTDELDNWARRRAESMAVANVTGARYNGSGNGPYPSTGAGPTWVYNPYYDMYTYMPMSGAICNPFYGLCYYSPMAAYQTFFLMPMMYGVVPAVGFRGATSGGTSSLAASSPLNHATGTAASAPSSSASSPSRGGSISSGVGAIGGSGLGSGSVGSAGAAASHSGGTASRGK
jgi:hypothetical protein